MKKLTMKKLEMKKSITLALAVLLFGSFGSSFLWSEVRIVRKLPDTGVNKVEAQWSAPKPDIEKEEVFLGKTQFSGRLSLGGSGGNDSSGTTNYDFFTDSRFSLLQPLGSAGAIQISGTAFRKNVIGGLNQKYGGDFLFRISGLSFKFRGIYDDKANTVEDILKDEAKFLLDASVNIGFLPTLPISLRYSHRLGTKSDDPDTTVENDETVNENIESDEAKLNIAGSIGQFGVSLTDSFASQRDKLNSVNNTSFANELSVTSPVWGFFQVTTSISPDFSKVEYLSTTNTVSTTSLESKLGLIFPFNKDFSVDIYGGRLDTWLTREGPDAGTSGVDYQPHSAAWTASTGASYRNDSGIKALSRYELKAGENLFDHSLKVSGGFTGKDKSMVKDLSAKGEFSQNYGTNMALESNKLSWGTGGKLSPLDKMLISLSYQGSLSASGPFSATPLQWVHTGKLSYSHTPDPMLDYQLNAALTDSITESSNALKQQYGGKLSLKPQWNLKVYLFELGEDVALSGNLPAGSTSSGSSSSANPAEAVVSTLSYNMGIPVFSFLKTRYGLKWEWVNDTGASAASGAKVSGNNFQHQFSLTVSGKPIPLTFTADYLLSHGYRGLRHDVTSSLSVPIWKGLSLESRFSLSYYEEDGAWKLPFLFGLNASYQF